MPHFEIVLADERHWRFGRGTTIDLSFGWRYEVREAARHAVHPLAMQSSRSSCASFVTSAKL
jgi:hypothetical protein